MWLMTMSSKENGDSGEVNQSDRSTASVSTFDNLVNQAQVVSNFLKALGHDGRLTILCHLIDGPKSVTELEKRLSARQAVVSQQLARLRHEGLVSARRDGNAIYYSIQNDKARETVLFLANLFGESCG